MTIQSLAMDIIALAVVLVCAAYYSRKGFLAAFISFFGTLVALVAAALIAYNFAPMVFTQFFKPGLEEKMALLISQQGVDSLSQLLHGTLTFLPEAAIDAAVDAFDTSLNFAAPDIASNVVEQVLRPLVTPLIMVILYFVVFAVLRILLAVLRGVAMGVGRLPVINTVNRAFGGAMGTLVGALYVFIALCIIWGYGSITQQSLFEEVYFAKSLVWRLFSGLNFFAKM